MTRRKSLYMNTKNKLNPLSSIQSALSSISNQAANPVPKLKWGVRGIILAVPPRMPPLKYCVKPVSLALLNPVSNKGPRVKRERMTVFYSGHVQGVGFRDSAKSTATGFEVAGTVRNLMDGRVELIAEGDRAELDAFRAAIRDSGLAGFIRDENVVWSDATHDIRGFEIIR
jgi:acylphosphatase